MLRHVRVEYVSEGNTGAIQTDASHVLLLDSSAVVRSTYKALHLLSAAQINDLVVDTTVTAGYNAIYLGGSATVNRLRVRMAFSGICREISIISSW